MIGDVELLKDGTNEAADAANSAAQKANASSEDANGAASKINKMTASATTLPQGSNASVKKSDTGDAISLEFGIPRGNTGITPDITMNVSTGSPGTNVKISKSGTAEKPVFLLTVPRGTTGKTGPQGDTGPQGPKGDKGETGEGVPSGGIANQVLVKTTSDDYDTAWKTESISITLDENGNGTLRLERK